MNDNTSWLTAILAADRDFLIGFNTEEKRPESAQTSFRMPWPHGSMQDDMAFFRNTTARSPVVMGRKTLESIGRLLPGRLNLVFSRHDSLQLGAQKIPTLNQISPAQLQASLGATRAGLLQNWEQLEQLRPTLAGFTRPTFLIGGSNLLAQAGKRGGIRDFYLTCIDARLSGSAQFAESPVYLPQALCQQLRSALAASEPIQKLQVGARNRYAASIYHLDLRSN